MEHQETTQDITVQHIDKIVEIDNEGDLFTTSQIVAQAFDKEHKNVLQSIDNLECSEEFRRLNFQHTPYVHTQNGQTYPAYRMTRDGFAFLAMGFTGRKAAAWKEKFLEAFNAMEAALRARLEAPAFRMAKIGTVAGMDGERILLARELDAGVADGLRGMMRMAAYLDGTEEGELEAQLCQVMNVGRVEDIRTVYVEFAFQILWHKLFLFNAAQRERERSLEDGIAAVEGLIDAFACFGTTKSREEVRNYVLNFHNIRDFSEVKTPGQLEKLIHVTLMILFSRFLAK